MNNTNNISENTDNENPVKIEYVNPINTNEILNSKNSVIQPINNVNIENSTTEESEIKNDTTTEEIVEPAPTSKHKQKNKLLMVIIVLIVLIIILISILLIPKIFDKEKDVIEAPTQQETKITLSDIITNSTNNAYYNFLASIYTININNVNESIVFDLNSIDQTNPINKQITFMVDNRDLKITLNKAEDNTDNLNAIYTILDSIGQYYGHEVNEVGNYVSSLNNNYNFNTNGITTTEIINTNTIEISINIDTNISTVGLNSMYINLDELNQYKNNITNSSISLKKGDIILLTNSSNVYTILVGQRKELNNNTYNTITSVIELLYPEEINDFKSKFTSLSTISFDKYKITIDPVLDANTFTQYRSNYKFILIEITK